MPKDCPIGNTVPTRDARRVEWVVVPVDRTTQEAHRQTLQALLLRGAKRLANQEQASRQTGEDGCSRP
jgi:hypothetical protein